MTLMKLYLIVVLICISLMISNAEHFFHVSVGYLYVFVGEMSRQILGSFVNGLYVFLLFSYLMSYLSTIHFNLIFVTGVK
jgi:hypothetical protein